MTGWNDVALGDIVTLINGDRGRNYPSAKHRSTRGIPFVNAGLLVDGRVRPGGDNFISQERFELLRSGRVEVDDVLLCIRGSIGRVAIATADVVPSAVASSVVILRASPAVNPSFLHALLRSPAGQLRILEANNGAAQPNLGAGEVARFRFAIPSRATQDRIAEVLGSIDGLIENSRRQVEVLEKTARAIYREWFVRFRYPGHEDIPLVDSPLGPIPDGWKVSTCGDELTALGGGTPSKKEPAYWDDGEIPWFTPSDLTRSGWRYAAPPEICITAEGLARSSARLFPDGSVLMTSRATLGVLAIATFEATTNQGFIVIPPDERWSPGFIREWLDWHAEELASVATGATFREITKGAFKRVPFLVPAQDVLDAHREATHPLESEVRILEEQARKLTCLRDLLLPKLVTGQIDVSHLDLDELAEVASA